MKIIVNQYKFTSPYVSKETNFVSMSDLHWIPGGKNEEIITSLGSAMDRINPDFIVGPGDLINSPTCLNTKEARYAFTEAMRTITGERLFLYDKGNHEGMIGGGDNWKAVELTVLEDTLSKLYNTMFLDALNGFSLADSSLISKGYTTANIHVTGSAFPASYYIDEKERLEAYLTHLLKMFEDKEKPFKDNMQNILLLHDVRKLIILLERGMLPQSIISQLEGVLLNGGHNHGGGVPNWLSALAAAARFSYGLCSPGGELLPKHVEGCKCTNGIYTIQNGYCGDFKPDSDLINSVYGTFDRPAISKISFIPGEKSKLKRCRSKLI